MITQFISEGKIVPVEVTVMLIKKAMAASGGSKFLVDGFPRNQDNLDGWFRVMGDTAIIDGVLFYECPEAVMEARLLKRGESFGRSDDKADVIKKRFAMYVRETMPVVDHFRGEGKVRCAREVGRGVAPGTVAEQWARLTCDCRRAVGPVLGWHTLPLPAPHAAATSDDPADSRSPPAPPSPGVRK